MYRTPSFLRTTALAAALVTGSLIAAAQTSAPASPASPAPQATQPEHHARMAERHQQRLEQLKTRLQLTPEQEPDRRADAPRGERPDLAAMTTPQRIERMKAWQAQRQSAHEQRMEATLSFYQALNPAQQQQFDQATAPGFMRTGMGHRHGHGSDGPQRMERPALPKGPQS